VLGRRPRTPTLADELQSSHRFTVAVLAAVLVLSLVSSGYLILVSQPRLADYVQLARTSRDVHDAMLDQETGVRAWLATGDPRFLEPYDAGRAHAAAASTELLREVQKSPDVTDEVLRTLLATEQWQTWARDAAATTVTQGQRRNGALERTLLEGKRLFDTYRDADAASTTMIRDRRTAALDHQARTLTGVLIGYLVLLGGSAVITMRRRRHLRVVVLDPIEDLHDTIGRLRDGDLGARARPTPVAELSEIGTALAELAAELDATSTQSTDRQIRLAFLADRFQTVVRVGREIAGSLSIRYVSATVTTAAAELLGTSTALWVRGDDGELHLGQRSSDVHGDEPPAPASASAVVLRAAADGVPVSGPDQRAYPLVLAGLVTGVLEVATADVDDDTEQVLVSLLSTAAAALESAHLHSTARELADMDGLTHLPNRRRFELDVDGEWERCRRYGRPLSLVMMDLDHFKRLNDEHGHLLGDQVLREVASALTAVLRTTDTAYRYGGEELVVLLRETGLEDGTATAERLRAAVAAVVVDAYPGVVVTASAGVAARHTAMSHYTMLVDQADKALYEAKRLGRDRVATAGEHVPGLPTAAVDVPSVPLKLV
jgi:diguanylate cyclase (GGDEF)-like protein